MRQAGLVGCHRRRPFHTTRRDPEAEPAPDLVQRTFAAPAPRPAVDRRSSPTCRRQEGFLYLAVILDVFSRRVVGWSMADHLRTELVVAALEMAVWNRRSSAPASFTILTMAASTLRCSSGNAVRPWASAAPWARSATATTTPWRRASSRPWSANCSPGSTFWTHQEARTALFEYIEVFYNRQRRHSALGYLSPEAYERSWAPQTPVVA